MLYLKKYTLKSNTYEFHIGVVMISVNNMNESFEYKYLQYGSRKSSSTELNLFDVKNEKYLAK